jgi:hypothetical protein
VTASVNDWVVSRGIIYVVVQVKISKQDFTFYTSCGREGAGAGADGQRSGLVEVIVHAMRGVSVF